MSGTQEEEEIVMTPLRAHEGTVLKVERVPASGLNQTTVQHFAGGPYKGIIINKAANEVPDPADPDTLRDFACYIADPKSKSKTKEAEENLIKEKRQLRFWFYTHVGEEDMENQAEVFYQDVINPKKFPKDYVGYIKRVIILLRKFPGVRKVELEMRPPRPGEDDNVHLVRQQITRITRTVMVRGRGQEDHRLHEDEDDLVSGGQYEDGYDGSSASTPAGATRDRSARNMPSQEDQHRMHGRRGVDGEYMDDEYEGSSSSAPGGASRWRRDPTQEDRLRQKGQNGYIEDSIQAEYTAGSSSTPLGSTRGRGDAAQDDLLKQNGFQESGKDTMDYHNSHPKTPLGQLKEDSGGKIRLSRWGQTIIWVAKKQRLLNVLEDAYPDILSADDLVRLCEYKKSDMMTVAILLNDLKARGMINEVTGGRYMRVQTVTKTVTVDEQGKEVVQTAPSHVVKVVQNVPVLSGKEQPTVAIVTLLYCEKLAVDAMIDNKTTYVKYKTEGEGQVYTLGNIGKHKVVSTKLSRIGYGEGEQVAAGNYVTRLLGTFNKVEHVILVGVGGGIPNFNNDGAHVRLGDVVVSRPEFRKGPLYIMFTGVDEDSAGNLNFNTRSWNARMDALEKLVGHMEKRKRQSGAGGSAEWERYLTDGLRDLEGGEIRFIRPGEETDRLYRGAEEVAHPEPAPGSHRALRPTIPVVHYGCVGAGKKLLKDEGLKMDFSQLNEVKVIDPGFQAVMESIDGNRTDNFAVIRGVSDYADGSTKKEWQPYAALAASAVMKALIKSIPIPDHDD